MGTPPLQKNGKDHLQDAALRDMEASNKASHDAIIAKIGELDKDVLITHVRNEEREKADAEREKSERTSKQQRWAIGVLMLSTLIGLVAWVATEFRDLHQAVNDNTSHFHEFQAIGIEWGDNIDARALQIQADLRELRKLVQQHQINKREHAHSAHK